MPFGGMASVKDEQLVKQHHDIVDRQVQTQGATKRMQEHTAQVARICLFTIGIFLVVFSILMQRSYDAAQAAKQLDDIALYSYQATQRTTESFHSNKFASTKSNRSFSLTDSLFAPQTLNALKNQTFLPSTKRSRSLVESAFDPQTYSSKRTLQTAVYTGRNGTAIFYALADIPYNKTQVRMLRTQILNIPEDAEFVVHLGDIRSAHESQICYQSEYTSVATILRMSRVPVFVILGDNEWNDCPNPEDGLQYWKDEFIGFENNWNHTFKVYRMPSRQENFSFLHKGTLFIGLNLVGAPVLDLAEWYQRLTEEADWTISLIKNYTYYVQNGWNADETKGRVVIFGHADPIDYHTFFFKPLRDYIAYELKNKFPILYINGDTHEWYYQPDFMNQPSVLRITLAGEGREAPLKVMVNSLDNSASVTESFVTTRRSNTGIEINSISEVTNTTVDTSAGNSPIIVETNTTVELSLFTWNESNLVTENEGDHDVSSAETKDQDSTIKMKYPNTITDSGSGLNGSNSSTTVVDSATESQLTLPTATGKQASNQEATDNRKNTKGFKNDF